MFARRVAGVLIGLMVVGGLWGARADEAKEKPARKSGTVVGVVAAKGPTWVEVRADGEQRPRRYTAHWRGGAPKSGGGPDKETVATLRDLKIGSRVRLEWSFHERPRIDRIAVLKAPAGKSKEKDAK